MSITYIGDQISQGAPRWYVGAGAPGTVSHLLKRGDGDGGASTLCGYTIGGPEGLVVSLVAKHCSSCTSRLRRFTEEATVEHDFVRETVTVVVVRPADGTDTSQDLVATALGRRKKWTIERIDQTAEPFQRPAEGVSG